MKRVNSASLLTVMIGTALFASACVSYPSHHHRGYGYGYASYGYQHDLRYDNHLGVYVVVGRPHYYYHDHHYYRYDRGRWYSSRELDGGWRDYDARKLPPGLAKKYGHGKKKRRYG